MLERKSRGSARARAGTKITKNILFAEATEKMNACLSRGRRNVSFLSPLVVRKGREDANHHQHHLNDEASAKVRLTQNQDAAVTFLARTEIPFNNNAGSREKERREKRANKRALKNSQKNKKKGTKCQSNLTWSA